ncbi:ABC transporter ATP-binding protein [Desulfoferula mesophila]|uniref:ABC transporter ATP-binding protein n=1 Tax=Desulfoferula mesophila TaxID=3058419 RepID=A0AAU9EGG6_9BACT|nr:ABC transporter ATP-binding protein [Desulfoferula mesophilus]
MDDQVVLEARGLSKNFGALQVINDVNLQVRRGAIHSIIGPNGAGKTTLFNLLTGFLKASSGRVIYQGKDITDLPPFKVARMGMARSFQITSVFPELTVHENVRVSAQATQAHHYNFMMNYKRLKQAETKADAVLASIGLYEQRDQLCKNLSYGDRRVLDIGISQATEPQLVLLDEPLAGLQAADHERLVGLIEDMAHSMTVVLIDHNIDIVTSVSHVITVLNQGQVIAEGTPEEVKGNPKVQEAYLGGV